ncbi:ROK family protein [Sphingomonas quercus]|uniref:ROK family protein n=1 Tax=Sphingomonas quercus TaxID=2842451 RepID=A0ABS6BHY2_9SPHN|nr:ROK family protein [Sphingomonas quercus]MBU3077794.1 ROK family protein [Sphingomonas quercus]
MGETRLLAGIEAGGTKFVCGVAPASGGPSLATRTMPTRDPEATFADVAAFFAEASARHGPIAAAGIGSFGPLGVDPRAADYGRILHTPKPGWAGADLLGRVRAMLGVPAGIDTDVNAAALAEAAAAGRPLASLAYVTVGTGIGVGLVLEGRPVHGLGHPEGGHMLIRRHPAQADFAGICPFHGDCLEGLASGPAVLAAWGAQGDRLPPDHDFWTVEADYLAQLCANLVFTVAPERIILGGGVMSGGALIEPIRRRTHELLGGYIAQLDGHAAVTRLITPPACVEPSGLVGAYLLASRTMTDMSVMT